MARTVRTQKLEIAYQESGPADGAPVILLHGWPSDPHDWDAVAPPLAASGCRVLVPWLRGFGPTRFLDAATPRSGQQAALGSDVRDFMDALGIGQALLGGYDWGGRGACVMAALVARARAWVGVDQRLQHPEHSHRGSTGGGGAGTSPLVSVVFPHRTRSGRSATEPPRYLRVCYGGSGHRTGNSTR